MTEQELKRLSRGELLQMLIAQMEEKEQLKNELEKAETQLADRKIALDEAGSIAEAALQLNGIYDAAQAAAQQYLDNIQQLQEQQEAVCQNMQQEAEQYAAACRQEADEYAAKIRAEAEAYWSEVIAKAKHVLEAQQALHDAVQAYGKEDMA